MDTGHTSATALTEMTQEFARMVVPQGVHMPVAPTNIIIHCKMDRLIACETMITAIEAAEQLLANAIVTVNDGSYIVGQLSSSRNVIAFVTFAAYMVATTDLAHWALNWGGKVEISRRDL